MERTRFDLFDSAVDVDNAVKARAMCAQSSLTYGGFWRFLRVLWLSGSSFSCITRERRLTSISLSNGMATATAATAPTDTAVPPSYANAFCRRRRVNDEIRLRIGISAARRADNMWDENTRNGRRNRKLLPRSGYSNRNQKVRG